MIDSQIVSNIPLLKRQPGGTVVCRFPTFTANSIFEPFTHDLCTQMSPDVSILAWGTHPTQATTRNLLAGPR